VERLFVMLGEIIPDKRKMTLIKDKLAAARRGEF
jgi:hypothetical protein